MTSFSLPTPSDFHVHLRDDARTTVALAHTAQWCSAVMAMPNLTPPLTTAAAAVDYAQRLRNMVPAGSPCTPYTTLYLTENTPIEEIAKAAAAPEIIAAKYYPAGATTNSDAGVRDWKKVIPQLKKMAELGLVLAVHGEVMDEDEDVYSRERIWYTDVAPLIMQTVPNLRMVCEHLSTAEGAKFVSDSGENVAATVTPQHLLYTTKDLLEYGLHAHMYCMPIVKNAADRAALRSLVTSGHPRVFAGTDSAPHPLSKKMSPKAPAGCYTADCAAVLYAHVFDAIADLTKPETQAVFTHFMSTAGRAFYTLPAATITMTLQQKPQTIPEKYAMSDGDALVPLMAGKTINWSIITDTV